MRNNHSPGGADWSDMTGDELNDFVGERMLDGAPGGPPALSRLLAAASAPGRASELAGENAAAAAFRALHAAPVRPAAMRATRRRVIAHHERPRVWPRRVTMRLAVAAGALLTVAAAGGVAVASGVVPAGPLRNLVPIIGQGGPPDHRSPGRAAGGPSGDATHPPDGTETSPADPRSSSTPNPTPSNLIGLCHSFEDAAAVDLAAAKANPRFAVLVTLAGGKDEVPAYCAKIVDDKTTTTRPPIPPSASVTRQ
jgi:hypothetical protein